jgi:hypothetical protein
MLMSMAAVTASVCIVSHIIASCMVACIPLHHGAIQGMCSPQLLCKQVGDSHPVTCLWDPQPSPLKCITRCHALASDDSSAPKLKDPESAFTGRSAGKLMLV